MSRSSKRGPLAEVELPDGALLIADLHLLPGACPRRPAFLGWLRGLRSAPALVILGDLFEYWVGPAQAREPACAELLAHLAEAVRAGLSLELVHGNRDFLLGRDFERATGARVHARGFVARLPRGRRALLIHGDELATLDRSYQRLRALLRSRPVGALARGLPLPLAGALARRLRRGSRRAVAAKPQARLALQAGAAAELATRHGAEHVVCGHAHRYRTEKLEGGARWTVLDAFGGEHDVLRVEPDGSLRPVCSGAAFAAAAPPDSRP